MLLVRLEFAPRCGSHGVGCAQNTVPWIPSGSHFLSFNGALCWWCSLLQNSFYFFPKPLYAIQIPCKIFPCFQCICGFTRPPAQMSPVFDVLWFRSLRSPRSRTHSLAVWRSRVPVTFLCGVSGGACSWLSLWHGCAFSLSVLFLCFLPKLHLPCISFLWPFVTSSVNFFLNQFFPLQ